MTRLSVNINKIATLRNARGGNTPDVIQCALDIERFGAQGITVHPRPDERHIRYSDVRTLKKVLNTEFNIEGNPKEKKFIDLVLEVIPAQVTLVPDAQNQITSNHGWDTIKEAEFLKEMIQVFKLKNIRTAIFVDPVLEMIEGAAQVGADRIELYTESYAHHFVVDKKMAVQPYVQAAARACELGLGVNAGHDLNLKNLRFFNNSVEGLQEVSIGHALISDALYYGLENTVQMYIRELNKD